MFDAVANFFNGLRHSEHSTLSVPILDGAFRPNNLLEEAPVVLEREGLEDMALGLNGTLFLACGNQVLVLDAGGAAQVRRSYSKKISALAILQDGRLAAALGDCIEIEDGGSLTAAAGQNFHAITAMSVASDGRLLVCDASARHSCDDWQHDLMNRGASGRLLAIDPVSLKAQLLQGGLAWPYGIMQQSDGSLLASESWRHSLKLIGSNETTPKLPGYPARLTPTADGGFWLALFSGRMQIVEFVLTERDFRREMMATIEPKYWISPAYSSGQDFLEPLQGGSVKQMGILKPWAPPRSYGLAVRFDAKRNAIMSVHSRVGGHNHGIVKVLERGTEVLALSKGAGRLLRLDLDTIRIASGLEGLQS